MGDFIHQLAENNVVVFVKHDDCARRQTFQRAVNDFDAVVFQKLVITQSGKRNNVAQAFRAAKTRLCKRQVSRNAQYDGILHFCGQLIKLTN
ncbi:hypothetical protein SEEE2651_03288 [Salmonella enterica subsp. enterica serovar Enteritidis str. 76-2651]|nr:hypothetical protein SEEE2651_03288 [Salmonella enterica subsp. enterica serovar Enteritidis str. 76-2651]